MSRTSLNQYLKGQVIFPVVVSLLDWFVIRFILKLKQKCYSGRSLMILRFRPSMYVRSLGNLLAVIH